MITSTDQDLEKKALPESVLILGKVVSQTGGCCPSLLGHKPLARCKLEAGVLDKNRTRIQPFPRQSFSSEETVDTARYNTHAPSSWRQRWKSKPSQEEPAAACSMELQTSRKSQKSTRGRIQSVVQQTVYLLAGIPRVTSTATNKRTSPLSYVWNCGYKLDM